MILALACNDADNLEHFYSHTAFKVLGLRIQLSLTHLETELGCYKDILEKLFKMFS
jgi:hypothetical protein